MKKLLLLLLLATPLFAEEKGQTFDGPAGAIWYEVRGAGTGTPLMMVNGGPGFDHIYLHVAQTQVWDKVGRGRPVIFYDQRGTGRSHKLAAGESCTLDDQVADLEALRAHLGYEKVDLFGHSWGGFLSMAYATRHPDRVRRLVICDSAAPKFTDTLFLFDQIFPDVTEKQKALKESDPDYIRLYLSMIFLSPEKRTEFLSHAGEMSYTLGTNQKVFADIEKTDLGPDIAKITAPALVLTGRFDINVAPLTAWKIAKAIPGAKFQIFERSGHLPFFEEPEAFLAALTKFLDS